MRFYCKKSHYLKFYFGSPKKVFLKGKIYQGERSVREGIDVFEVHSEDDRHIGFSIENDATKFEYYKKYFYTEQEIRKIKLYKINSPFKKILKYINEKL